MRTAGYHQVCAADEDRYDVCWGGEYWEQCGMFPERIDWMDADPNASPQSISHQRGRDDNGMVRK